MFVDMLTIGLLLIGFIGSLAFLILGFLYLQYFKRKEEEIKNREQHADTRAQEILEHTHNRVRSMLEKTTEKAEAMLLETEYLSHHLKRDVQETLDKVLDTNNKLIDQNSKAFFEAYQKELSTVKESYFTHMQTIIEEIKKDTEQELKDFVGIIVSETVEAQGFIGKKINDEFEKAKGEIQEYKKEELKKVEESINKIIVNVSTDVIGKSISLNDHEALLLEALEKAQKEGVFLQ